MPARDEYREKAVDCVASAEFMLYPAERAAMLQIAHGYIMLADHVGRHSERGGAVSAPANTTRRDYNRRAVGPRGGPLKRPAP
jgi:hypothetical protein